MGRRGDEVRFRYTIQYKDILPLTALEPRGFFQGFTFFTFLYHLRGGKYVLLGFENNVGGGCFILILLHLFLSLSLSLLYFFLEMRDTHARRNIHNYNDIEIVKICKDINYF